MWGTHVGPELGEQVLRFPTPATKTGRWDPGLLRMTISCRDETGWDED